MKCNKFPAYFLAFSLMLIFQSCKKEELSNQASNTINLDQKGVATQWMSSLLDVERYASGMRPNASARALAYINLAAYETAAPFMNNYSSVENQLQGFNIRGEDNLGDVDVGLALNACYAEVIDHFLFTLPNQQKSQIEQLKSTIQNSLLGSSASQSALEASLEWGENVAEEVIRYSRSDQQAERQILDPQPVSYVPPTGEGFWTFSDRAEAGLFPYWESVRTFVISPDETTTRDPISYSENPGSAYYNEMMEVYNINNAAQNGDTEQLHIAHFWSDDVEGLTFSPPARQFAIANQLVEQFSLDLEETLALFLKLGFSMNDAAVATWKYKYEHMVMRPSVYITDHIDQDFQTNLYSFIYWPNPGFPGYPSGHSCFASAASGIFSDMFGNQTNFTDRSHQGRTEFLSAPRSFSSFDELAEENDFSRIPLGVHIRMDCVEGLRLGYEISDAINDFDLFGGSNVQ